MQNKPIPVSIISGFLGAGKTTFINHLLKENPSIKFAIIENEYGEQSIDNQLIKAKSDTILEINHGCICCTLNENLVQTLNHLLNNYTFDHLIIETTGIAEPSGVVAPFLIYHQLKQNFIISNVIVIVDGYNLEEILAETDLAARQIAFADILIINKLDLITPSKAIEIESILKTLNPDAKIVFCEYGKIPNLEIFLTKKNSIFNMNQFHHEHYEHSHEHLHTHQHPYNSVYIEESKPLDIIKFQHWMNMMLQIQYGRIYRVKGWVKFYGFEHALLFQSVGKQFVLDKTALYPEKNLTQLVFIGLALEKQKIEKIIKNLVYKT